MRRAVFALTMLVLLAPLAAAQGDGFAAFWKEFSAAAAKKDKDKIRALTLYPSPEFEQKSFDAPVEGRVPDPDARVSRQGEAGARRQREAAELCRVLPQIRSTASKARRRAGASLGRIPTIDGNLAPAAAAPAAIQLPQRTRCAQRLGWRE